MSSITIHKSYKDLATLQEHLVPQGQPVTFIFPNTLSNDDISKITKDARKLNVGCGSCTTYSIQPDLNQITFVVTAPSFNEELSTPYLKSVMPKFKSELGNEIHFDIKFYVNPKK
jgi:hypothetical protein